MKKFNLKKYPICDYGQVLDSFVTELQRLEDHIRAHKVHVDWKRDADEIKKARQMYGVYRKACESVKWEEEPKALANFFNYVRDHIQGWWC